MKKTLHTIGFLILIFSFCFMITGCSTGNKSDTVLNNDPGNPTLYPTGSPTITPANSPTITPTNNPTIAPTNIPTMTPTVTPESSTAPSEESLSLEAYKSVLQNNNPFYSPADGTDLYLKELLSNGSSGYNMELSLSHFTVLDLDGDKLSEIVLELSFPGSESPDLYEVLHYMDGKVYGYLIPYRGLEELKSDGSLMYSNGAADWGFATLKFTSASYEYNYLGYSAANGDGVSYFIDNNTCTEDEFNAFRNKQESKTDAEWFEFSQEKIDTVLGI